MWKAIIFTIGLILALSVVGFVIYTFVAGTGTTQCSLDSDCPTGQGCSSCNGVWSCQPKCPSGETRNTSGDCECVSVASTNWKCNSSGKLPICNKDSTCDPETTIGCYKGLSNCSTGCMYGSFSGGTAYYLYNPSTKKTDMILYIFTDYPGDLSSYRNEETQKSIKLCDGSEPSTRSSVTASTQRLTTTPTNTCCSLCLDDNCEDNWKSKDYCPKSTAVPREFFVEQYLNSHRLESGSNNYYFQNLSSRMVCLKAGAEGDGSNQIQITLDGSQDCGRKTCLGKNSSTGVFEISKITVNGTELAMYTGKKSVQDVKLKNNYTCVFVDIPCNKLSL